MAITVPMKQENRILEELALIRQEVKNLAEDVGQLRQDVQTALRRQGEDVQGVKKKSNNWQEPLPGLSPV